MTYTPNWASKPFRRRAILALDFCTQWLPSGKRRKISKTVIDAHFGNTGRQGPGRWLKEYLLFCEDSYYNMQTGECKLWSVRQDNLGTLRAYLREPEKPAILSVVEESSILTGEFIYKEKSGRSYHRLQNLPRRKRQRLFGPRGYQYEYDIESCALTLLLQRARQCGLTHSTALLDTILEDRQAVRKTLADELNLTTAQIKSILAKILNGARISSWHTSKIFEEVNWNPLMIRQLQANPTIQQYQWEVKQLWAAIRPTLNLHPGERIDRHKSRVYLELEQMVTKVIAKQLKKEMTRAFWIHDGVLTDRAIDISHYQNLVRTQTGFNIRLDWCIYES